MDTLGNKLCIEELYSCPINKLKIVLNSKVIDYLGQGNNVGYLNNLSSIYNLFYSNNFINGIVFNTLIKSEKKTKYIDLKEILYWIELRCNNFSNILNLIGKLIIKEECNY